MAGFDLPDCPGHAIWNASLDWSDASVEAHPFALISGQPGTRLHSQFDNGSLSVGAKIKGREPVLIHPEFAKALGVSDQDIVELFNTRGRCLVVARITSDIARGVLFLWAGAWYDPDFGAPQAGDRHGNPNVLTHDLRTSEFSQSPAAHSARVGLRRLDGDLPQVMAHRPPEFAPAKEDKAQ